MEQELFVHFYPSSVIFPSKAILFLKLQLFSHRIVSCYKICFCFYIVGCPVEGQVLQSSCLPDGATCDNPNPGIRCFFGECACPSGQVIDENTNACVNIEDCGKY